MNLVGMVRLMITGIISQKRRKYHDASTASCFKRWMLSAAVPTDCQMGLLMV